MESRMRSRLEAHRCRRGECLQVGLHIEEIHGAGRHAPLLLHRRTVGRGGHAHGLAHAAHRERAVAHRRVALESAADLEDADAGELARLVVADIGDERAHQRAAHHRKSVSQAGSTKAKLITS